MLVLELPEGAYIMLDAIVAVAPRVVSEFDHTVNGTLIHLSSGHTLQTDETVERILAQVAELARTACD